MRQNKCTATMPLDKTRIWLDFNEFCAIAKEDQAPIYLFSQADITNDSNGKDVTIYDGMEVSVFDDDYDNENMPDALLADGIIIKNFLDQYPKVKWLIKLVKHKKNYKSGNEYVYWMSDLQ